MIVEMDTVHFLEVGKQRPLYFLEPACSLYIIYLSHLGPCRAANRWRRDARSGTCNNGHIEWLTHCRGTPALMEQKVKCKRLSNW